MVTKLEGLTKTRLYPTLLFEYNCLHDLIEYLISDFSQNIELTPDQVESSGVFLFTPVWLNQQLPKQNNTQGDNSCYLFFSQLESARSFLENSVPQYFSTVEKVDISKKGNTFFWDWNEPQKYKKNLSHLDLSGKKLRIIVSESGILSSDSINRTGNYESIPKILFHFIQALLSKKGISAIEIALIFNNSETLKGNIFRSSLALFRTISLENHRIRFTCIEYDKPEEEILPLALRELDSIRQYSQMVRYKGHERLIKSYKDIDYVKPFRQKYNGSYLITGGTGRIGFQLALHLLKRDHNNIILLARRPLTKDQIHQLNATASSSDQWCHYSCDIKDKEKLERIFTSVREIYGRIHGVYHCAGYISDKVFINHSFDDFQNVLSPKIQGTINLYQLIGEEVDFILCFSSITAILGNLGQSDYSYANHFMDNLAELQLENNHMGKIKSINWPLWEEGGDEQSVW